MCARSGILAKISRIERTTGEKFSRVLEKAARTAYFSFVMKILPLWCSWINNNAILLNVTIREDESDGS